MIAHVREKLFPQLFFCSFIHIFLHSAIQLKVISVTYIFLKASMCNHVETDCTVSHKHKFYPLKKQSIYTCK